MMHPDIVRSVLTYALKHGAEFAELFVEDKEELSIKYNSGIVQGIAQARLNGAGIYLISGTQSTYVYLNDLTEAGLLRSADTACQLLAAKNKGIVMPFRPISVANPCPVITAPGTVSHAEKIKLLQKTDAAGRGVTNLMTNLNLAYTDCDQRVLIANSEGTWAEDRRVTSRLRLIPTLQNGMETVSHFSEFTRAQGFEAFKGENYLDFAQERIRSMEGELFAAEAPSGFVPVVFEGGGCTGTFFHEACGHQLEATGLTEHSIFRHKMGQKIASDKVTLIDDGSLPGLYGSSMFDDEGMPRQKNVLIENGVLTSFLADRLGAKRIGCPRTASGRRQGYGYAPRSRMSNTYLAAGNDDPDEMIRSMPEGLFVTEIGGGTGGDEFTLLASKAYWVKNGQIDHQVKGAILLGRGDETMMNIDRVGNVMVQEDGGSFCGADSGLVCTTTSGARMRVTGMVVGGKGGSV